jgi:hypothetical protein
MSDRLDRLRRRLGPGFGPLLEEILNQMENSPYTDGRPACYLVPHLEEIAGTPPEQAAYNRGRADKELEITKARAVMLMATMDEPGGLQPYEGSQVSSGLNVDTAGAAQLRDEVRRLDLRLRWLLRHYDDAMTSHMVLQDELYQKGVADGRRLEQLRQAGQP